MKLHSAAPSAPRVLETGSKTGAKKRSCRDAIVMAYGRLVPSAQRKPTLVNINLWQCLAALGKRQHGARLYANDGAEEIGGERGCKAHL